MPQKIWDLGLRGHEVHGWPEGYAYGASVSGGHLKNGKRVSHLVRRMTAHADEDEIQTACERAH